MRRGRRIRARIDGVLGRFAFGLKCQPARRRRLFAKRDRRLTIILWFTASWSLIFLASVPLTRYHFAIIPMITVLAAVAFVSAWEWLARR